MFEFFISALLATIAWAMWIKKQPIPNNTGAKTGTTTPTTQPSVPPSNKIKTALTKWWGWILGGAAIVYGLYLIPYGQGWEWLKGLPYEILPLWVYPIALLILAVLIAGMQDGKTGSDKLKKLAELFGAFAKLGLMLAIIAVLAIFIVGPKMFWKGDYHYTPPPAPSGVAQAAHKPESPKEFLVTAEPGDTNDSTAPWSAPVRFGGRGGMVRLVGKPAPFAIKTEAGTIYIIKAGTTPDLGEAPEQMQFLSLTNRQLEIKGRVE